MRGFKLYLLAGALLLILYVVAEYNRPVPTNWGISYKRSSKIPFGTYLLFQRLGDIFPEGVKTSRQSTYLTLKQAQLDKPLSYLVIAPDYNPDKTDIKALLRFTSAGNAVFLAVDDFGYALLDTLKIKQTSAQPSLKSNRSMHFTGQNRQLNFRFQKGQLDGCFYQIKNKAAQVLGRNNLDSVNFIAIRFGKGTLYLHSNPSVFANYNLMQPATQLYASTALSYLPKNYALIWDDYTLLGAEGVRSPMRFVLNNDNLRWAWYIATATLLLFVLAEMKRRQRIIPIIPKPENRSLEFVNVVGQVYYEERNHTDLARKMVTYFSDDVRIRFDLNLQENDPEFAGKLARKSGAALDDINILMGEISHVQNAMKFDEKNLIALNLTLENFYKETR